MSAQAPCVERLIDEKTISDVFKHCMLTAARFATNSYDGYEAHYSTQNNLFTTTTASHFSGSRNAAVHWQGKRIELARAKGFPGEFTVNDDLGSDAKIYERRQFACVEGHASSAGGTAVHHISVYLMEMQPITKSPRTNYRASLPLA
jgi:hypothetical protein